MLHVGFENIVTKDKIIAITRADTAPAKRNRQHAEDVHKAIDCSYGRKVKSLVHLVDGYIVLSASEPKTLSQRMSGE